MFELQLDCFLVDVILVDVDNHSTVAVHIKHLLRRHRHTLSTKPNDLLIVLDVAILAT